jgi:two-component system nitrate/nitrite response regulator NarL
VSADIGLRDSAVLAGASGVVSKTEPVGVLARAIEKIHAGEL